MPLLADYAITPDVFDTTSYSSEEVCRLRLNAIARVMMEEGLVRDLRAGQWRKIFANGGRPWHKRSQEIVRKLATQGRLIQFPATMPRAPVNDREWCAEALLTHTRKPMKGGVIVTEPVKSVYKREPLVERIDLLSRAPWWTRRSSSLRLRRTIEEYRSNLEPILRCANSLQFIDPHLNPARQGYKSFAKLLECAGKRDPSPLIEIHRVCYEGSPPNRRFLEVDEIERVFRNELATPLQKGNLRAHVFIWNDFHDRFLLSNLMGIMLGKGFDTERGTQEITTWTRLGRIEHDDIQREFDKASGQHRLEGEFTLP